MPGGAGPDEDVIGLLFDFDLAGAHQDEHELDGHGSPLVSEGTPRHWRLRAQQLHALAFDHLRVCSSTSTVASLLPCLNLLSL